MTNLSQGAYVKNNNKIMRQFGAPILFLNKTEVQRAVNSPNDQEGVWPTPAYEALFVLHFEK